MSIKLIIGRKQLNVRVEVDLASSPKGKHKKQMYDVAEYLTIDTSSISISIPQNKPKVIIAEFTIKKARQIDVVDRIGKEFSYEVDDYDSCAISFPAKKKVVRKQRTKADSDKEELTDSQRKYLVFINNYITKYGLSPKANDIGLHFGITPSSVYRMLVKLEEKGFIQRSNKEISLLIPANSLP